MSKRKREKIINLIEFAENEYGKDFDLKSDWETKVLFNYVCQILGLSQRMVLIEEEDDAWIEMHYFSEKINKGIIWDCEVGNFDDYEEVADYLLHTSEEIKAFEKRLPRII